MICVGTTLLLFLASTEAFLLPLIKHRRHHYPALSARQFHNADSTAGASHRITDPLGRRSVLSTVSALVTVGVSLVPLSPAWGEANLLSGSSIDPNSTVVEVTDRCYMKFAVDEVPLGVITFDLYGKVAPKTVANFVSLCSGSGPSKETYKGSSVFRIIPGLNIGLGDIAGNGDACVKAGTCKSSFREGPFPVDNFDISHTVSGLVSMARGLEGSADSRFLITLPDDAKWADGRYTAFGRLGQTDDSMAVAAILGGVEVSGTKNKPKKRVEIVDCGVL